MKANGQRELAGESEAPHGIVTLTSQLTLAVGLNSLCQFKSPLTTSPFTSSRGWLRWL
jgi:hypothetical protein